MSAQAAKPGIVIGVYSAPELARLVGVSPAVVRRYALAGILGEQEEASRFGFADVVLLRAILGLRKARVSSVRIRRALERLRQELPAGVPVSAVSIEPEAGRIVARFESEVWDLESGQRVLDLSRPQAGMRDTAVASVGQRVEEWFQQATDIEDSDPDDAARLYRRVLALDRDHPAAHLNLGRLLHEQGDLYLAERHYRRAIAIHDLDPTAWFNLGVVLEDRNRRKRAVEAYERATQLDDQYADGFFNLGNLYQQLGEAGMAMRCFRRYRKLTKGN